MRVLFFRILFVEKLNKSEGRELRKALFTLKQIFQEDKDLVHGFVALGGLNCLVKIGRNADQNHQNYILRALGQVNVVSIVLLFCNYCNVSNIYSGDALCRWNGWRDETQANN